MDCSTHETSDSFCFADWEIIVDNYCFNAGCSKGRETFSPCPKCFHSLLESLSEESRIVFDYTLGVIVTCDGNTSKNVLELMRDVLDAEESGKNPLWAVEDWIGDEWQFSQMLDWGVQASELMEEFGTLKPEVSELMLWLVETGRLVPRH